MLGLIRKKFNKTTPAFALTVEIKGVCVRPKNQILLLQKVVIKSTFDGNGYTIDR